MSPSELAVLFEQNSTQPYRLVLDSGDRVVVAEPRKTIMNETTLFLRRSQDIEAPYGKVAMVSLFSIAMVEPIDRPSPPPLTRRRR